MDTGGGEAQVDHGTSLSVYYNEYFFRGQGEVKEEERMPRCWMTMICKS